MSELKAFDVGLGRYTEDGSPCVVAFDADQNPRLLNEQIYIKSEVDKFIEELKEQVHDYAQGLYVMQARAEMELRHSNRNRCLAMAKYCELREDEFGGDFAKRWLKRWLALAEEPTWEKFLQLIRKKAK